MSNSLSAALLALAALNVAATPSSTPREVVEEFLRLDQEGVRTSSSTAGRIEHLVEPGVKPGRDSAWFVRSAAVIDASVTGTEATVRVRYEIEGFFAGDRCYSIGAKVTENITVPASHEKVFRLRQTDGRWLIRPPYVGYHVSIERAKQIDGCIGQLERRYN